MSTHTAGKVMTELNERTQHSLAAPPQRIGVMLARITSIGLNNLGVTIAGGTPFSVAKATKVIPALQVSPMLDADGQSYTLAITDTQKGQKRTSTGPTVTEIEIVIPPYFVGDVIEIGPIPLNFYDEINPGAAVGTGMTWQEVNSPRYWAKE
jgi:hypothetical protein